ncbi:DUF3168 domain-containing protein [Paracoccus haeundaensis]|uniref:DUF3168 domain-containing protein n=1 Tax=Paracoccus haeundaensis TaxID=225362 RepID=A0A5C4RC37_9RHOB|nr:DUF3168 domain-containing protein [Paracoccus haeundaensis]TNH41277.1 DUF3168 domain-containing protein [Paracoccus haeundaensis]
MELEVQTALRARLVSHLAVTSLVPASNILDTNQRPAPRPSIILGESQAVDEGTSLRRSHTRIYHTLHVWTREPSLEGAKAIGASIRSAIRMGRLTLPQGLHCADLLFASQRFMRDPDGEHSHGVITVEILVSEDRP